MLKWRSVPHAFTCSEVVLAPLLLLSRPRGVVRLDLRAGEIGALLAALRVLRRQVGEVRFVGEQVESI